MAGAAERTVFLTGYSYKGGSARTTTAVNLALALAARGNLVVVIDGDLGAGGIRSLWREMSGQDSGDSSGEHGVHEFLRDYSQNGHRMTKSLVDRYNKHFASWDYWGNWPGFNAYGAQPADRSDIPLPYRRQISASKDLLAILKEEREAPADEAYMSGEVLFIPGVRRRFTAEGMLDGDAWHVARGLRALGMLGLDYLEGVALQRSGDYPRRRFVIVDSASGITVNSVPCLLAANVLMVFFRKSIQHHEGTIDNLKQLLQFLSVRRRAEYGASSPEQKVLLAATCVPERVQLQALFESIQGLPAGRDLRDTYSRIDEFWERVRRTGGASDFGRIVDFVGEFPEHPVLRQREIGVPFVDIYSAGVGAGANGAHALEVGAAHRRFSTKLFSVARELEQIEAF